MGTFTSDRSKVQDGIREGGWKVAFGREVTTTDAALGIIAGGVSIYSGNPAAINAWLNNLIDECIHEMEASLQVTFKDEARNIAQEFALGTIQKLLKGAAPGEIVKVISGFGCKAGVAKFTGQNKEWNPIAHPDNPFDAGEWQNLGPPLPSFCPYIGLRFTTSGTGGGNNTGGNQTAPFGTLNNPDPGESDLTLPSDQTP